MRNPRFDEGARVGAWKTWNIASPDEITVPAPPADTSDDAGIAAGETKCYDNFLHPYGALPDLACGVSDRVATLCRGGLGG